MLKDDRQAALGDLHAGLLALHEDKRRAEAAPPKGSLLWEFVSMAVVVAAAYYVGVLSVGLDVLKAVWHYLYNSDQGIVTWMPLVWAISAAIVAAVAAIEFLALGAVAWLLRQPFEGFARGRLERDAMVEKAKADRAEGKS